MNRLPWQIHIAVSAVLVLLQTTLFRYIEIMGVSPDIVLIFIVFSSNSRGSFQGQIISATSGLIEDMLSLAPLGFNTFTKSLLGYLFGKTRGKILFDPVFLPILYIIVATILKEICSYLVTLVFLGASENYFGFPFLIQVGVNIILTPLIYNIFRKLRIFGENEREV